MSIVEWIGLVSGIAGILSFSWYMYERRPIKRLSWRFAQKSAVAVVDRLITDRFDPSLIFGIGRGGAIWGAMLSGSLGHRPLLVIDRKYEWSSRGRFDELIFPVAIPADYLERVLLVAGEAHSGSTMNKYYGFLKSIGAEEIRRAVLFYEEGCPISIEYHGVKSSKKKLLMPWMYTKRYLRSDRVPVASQEFRNRIRLYLVRHGETTAGDDIFSGSSDFDLTVNGIEQACDAGRSFLGKNVQSIYSSPSPRARKTASIIRLFTPGANLAIHDFLREIGFGTWEGLSRETIRNDFQVMYELWESDPVSNVPDGGEHPSEVLKRLLCFLDEVATSYSCYDSADIVTVLHKNTIRILLSHLSGEPLKDYRKRQINTGEIFQIEYCTGDWRVVG